MPQVVEQIIEAPKVADQILDVLVLKTVEQSVKLPNTVSEDRIQERTAERIVDIPVPQDVEELVEVSKVFAQDRVKQRFVEQTIETPVFSIAEKAVEIPVVAQRQISMVQTVQRSIEIPPLQYWDEAIDVPVVSVVHVPRVWVVKKTVEDPLFEIVEKTVESPETQTIQGSDMLVTQVQVVEQTVETLQQNKILRVIEKNHVMKWMDMFDEIAELNDDRKKFYEQFVKFMKLGIRENSVDDLETAELLRFNTSKSGDEQISFKEYVDRMKEGQNDNYHITGESIAVVFPSSLREHLRKKDPVDEYAVQQLKEFDGTKLKPTTKEGLDFGDQDEKKTLEELKIEPEPLRKLMKEALGDKVEEAIVNDRIVDSLCFLTISEHSLSADMERIMKAQAPRDNSMQFASGSQQQLQAAQQERKEGRKEKSEKVEGEEWETVVGGRRKEEKRERKRDRREKVGT